MQDSLVSLASELIKAPSQTGKEGPAAAVMLEAFEANGFDEAYLDEVGNAIGVIRRGEGRTLMLNGHIDTVPVGDPDLWPYPPLSGAVVNERLWGRGACDMKSALACMVMAASDAAAAGFEGTLIVSGVVQEEVGGLGARHIAATLAYDAVVLGEPSKCRMMLGHRGANVVEVVFPGAIAHAARASLGENALAHVARYVLALEGLELPRGGALGGSSATPTRVVSSPSDSTNVVPGSAVLTVDYRSVPGEGPAEVVERLRSIAHDERIVVRIADSGRGGEDALRSTAAYLADPDAPAVRVAREAFGRALAAVGRRFEEDVWWFCTDAPHLARRGAAVIGFGPGEEELAHTTNESVAVADLHAARRAYAEFAKAYLARRKNGETA
ncbi:MAG: M20/M25/M40 family metallo-hydrolase [Trueperaceae bacterium]|nr:M20/M25/M40 family metallo-hydrolase [Trueperaceae bacterium]MCO5173009.1 M20/M25/M40 family metallo-hydrolase [Trueperaceae bacterium]MCW5820694.1 M20/M25/M40 family metallo-hydrolase [Trueperaceae bacterium]